LRTVCPGWFWTIVLLIPASQVPWITGMSHWHLTYTQLLHFALVSLLLITVIIMPTYHGVRALPNMASHQVLSRHQSTHRSGAGR
jgi:hypothetical protein